MSDFTRPKDGIKFNFLGMQTNNSPDSVPPGKYVYAQNIRAYSPSSIRTRPGQTARFATAGHIITDIGSYAVLSTDNLPRILARDSADGIYLDTGALITTLAGGGQSGSVSMIPFRPNASPNPYLYIANGSDYQKFSAPVANVVTAQKVGIAEPQSPPDAGVANIQYADETGVAANYTAAGVAAAPADTVRSSPTVNVAIADPVNLNVNSTRWSICFVGYTYASAYQFGQMLLVNGFVGMVADLINPNQTTSVTIQSIEYFVGATGRCVIVPSGLASASGEPTFSGGIPSQPSIHTVSPMPALRRGALLQLLGEVVFVLSVTTGPNGVIAIETSTTGAHLAGETLSVLPTLIADVSAAAGTPVGMIVSNAILSNITGAGVGTLTRVVNFFSGLLFGGTGPQQDDYLHFSFHNGTLGALNEVRILFDVGDGTFTQDYFYYSARPNDLDPAILATTTQIAAEQTATQRQAITSQIGSQVGSELTSASPWSEVVFPMAALTRVGQNGNPITSATRIRIWINANQAVQIGWGGVSTFGGGQPDVGDIGSPYFYRVRPRSSVTGAVGNPSPSTRYGVSPRRMQVGLSLPSAAYDSQIDTWDIERYGGSVTSWRFVGTTPSSNSTFIDNFDDAAAQAGDALDFDNFEPWPSIDIPNNGTASVVCGTLAVVNSTANANITSYLPGTLVRLGGLNVYTLWTRPTLFAIVVGPPAVYYYLLQFVESAGTGTNVAYQIEEPILANRHLPYMWGPDAAGTVFACGDALRAGTVYFAKNYAPDSAPDAYNMEITPPTEPLLGGEVLDGLCLVASTERWWALYPQSGNARQRYAPVQQPFPRGLATPTGHCTDGVSVYWWAKDGIYSSSQGSLTDADLYNLFPHEGVIGETITYLGSTLLPPDYSRAGSFRLAYANGYLYAVYLTTFGTYVNLVCQVATRAWSVDLYSDGIAVSVFYHPEQQAGTLFTSILTPARYDELLMGNTAGYVVAQTDLANDINGSGVANVPIACVLGTREDDAGDARAPKQWGDLFLDATPAATGGIAVSLIALGALVTTLPAVPSAAIRTRQPLSVSSVGDIVADFLGLRITWTDNFLTQSVPTTLNLWQPSFVIQPARDIEWFTFGTAFGMDGYHHLRQIALAYVSTAPITLTITSYDGLSPAPIVIPSSAGAYVKLLFPVGANKGLLHNFHAVSSAPFQIFLADSEFYVGAWGRAGAYLAAKSLGGRDVEPAIV